MKLPVSILTLPAVFLSILVISCQSNPGSTDNQLTGTLTGNVEVFNQYGVLQDDMSGVTVEAEGTSLSGITESDGSWRIENLPTGTYVIKATREGYTEDKSFGYQFVGGGTAHFRLMRIGQIPTFQLDSLAARFVSTTRTDTIIHIEDAIYDTTYVKKTDPHLRAMGEVDHSPPAEGDMALKFFVGRTPDVSDEQGTYLSSLSLSLMQDYEFDFDLEDWVEALELQSGETIYLIAYPVVYTNHALGYYDPVRQTYVDIGTSDNPSRVIRLDIP